MDSKRRPTITVRTAMPESFENKIGQYLTLMLANFMS
ncbi:unnamed protein product, partial [marine sediment metagenome]